MLLKRFFLYVGLLTLIVMSMHGWVGDSYQADGWVFFLCIMGLFFMADTTYIIAEQDLPPAFTIPIFGVSLVLFYIIAWHIRSVDQSVFVWFVLTLTTHVLLMFLKYVGDKLINCAEIVKWFQRLKR